MTTLKELIRNDLDYFDNNEENIDRLCNDILRAFPEDVESTKEAIAEFGTGDLLSELIDLTGEEIDLTATQFKGLVNIPMSILPNMQGKIMYNPEAIKKYEVIKNTDNGGYGKNFFVKIKFTLNDNTEIGTHLFAGINCGGDYCAIENDDVKVIDGKYCYEVFKYLSLFDDPDVRVVRLKHKPLIRKTFVVKFEMLRCHDS